MIVFNYVRIIHLHISLITQEESVCMIFKSHGHLSVTLMKEII